MIRKYIFLNLTVFLLLSWGVNSYSFEYQNADVKLYNKAKKEFLKQNWDDAIELFQKLIDEFPNSNYQDDAHFWLGYCLERKTGEEMEAFLAFDKLIKDFPNSPWVDDAIVHQISLAEHFASKGKDQYLSFLSDKLNKDEQIKQQAAIALGRLGDKRALPVLKTMKDDETLGSLAKSLIEGIESGKVAVAKLPDKTEQPTDLEILRIKPEDKIEESKERRDLLFFPSKRYKQYRAMLRTDDNWTKPQLMDFGMWQILHPDMFEEYYKLDNYDQKEWYRKFWKRLDPTPTTETNEAEEEFISRVNYARAHFSDFWNYRHFRYLRDQYIREGWHHAPWDARGEIYIKYGEPDFQTIAGFHQEEWTYWRYNVDFVINQYMTNVYGNAIYAGPMSRFIHRELFGYVDTHFIFNPEFKFHYDYKANPIKGFKLEMEDSTLHRAGSVAFNYYIKNDELKIIEANNRYLITYLIEYVVYDEDIREVKRNSQIVEFEKQNRKALKKEKYIKGNIKFDIDPGEYMLTLRIDDQNSDKLGIYVEDFLVKK